MEAKELRIGNLIKFISTDDIDVVLDINTRIIKKPSINNVNITDVEPILLTEEWLLRFGFKNLDDSQFYNKKTSKKYYLLTSSHQGYTEICVNDICGGQAVTKYVHQLQNLYFALTGEELVLSSEA